jgi:hypothetical protein
MGTDADIPKLERVTFFDGQRLSAEDLSTVQAYHQELRWLHNRSLHTWGIGLGLDATGNKGDRQVGVAPGYGVDTLGREIVLTESQVIPVPPVAAASGGGEAVYHLTVSYLGDADLEPTATRQGVCKPGGAVRLPERPKFAWKEPASIQRGYDLVLAQIWVLNCQLNRPVSLAVRRQAQPSQQPYIAAGQTVPGETAWSLWQIVSTAGQATTLGVQTTVDTSGARFRLTPRYLARIQGDRYLPATAAGPNAPQGLLVDGFTSVTDPKAFSFTLRIFLPLDLDVRGVPLNPDSIVTGLVDLVQNQLKWHVVWMGVEG